MQSVVLQVEPRDSERQAVEAALNGSLRVLSARTATEGLSLAAASTPDLVIFGPGLPDMTPIEACRRLRGTGRRSPVVLVLGHVLDAEWQLSALDAGVTAFLRADAQPRLVARQVQSLLAVGQDRRAILDAFSEGYYALDAEWRFLEFNAAAEEHFGCQARELTGKDFWIETGIPRDSVVGGNFRAAASGATTIRFETESQLRPGRWYETHLHPRGGGGLNVYYRDITARKVTERALTLSEEKFAKAFHGSTAAMTITCLADGRYLEVNRRWLETTGYRREDVIGRTASEINIWKRPEDREGFVRELEQHGFVMNSECDFHRAAGEEWIGLVSAQLTEIGNDTVIISSVLDITDRKRAEQALRQFNVQLAEADRRKDEFIAILSHELRNPLAPIRYALPLLQAQANDEAGTRALSVVHRQVDHLTRLVDDLLDISRISSGKIELRRDDVTLGSVVAAAQEAASPAIAAARHTLTLDLPDEPIWLHADAARMAQVLTNLLNNSARYTPRGGEILLQARRHDDRAVIRVRDNGIGIPAEALPSVFDMFKQVNRPDRSEGGLGIGLALARLLVDLHGGNIEAHSEGIGRGAEFVVTLPVARNGRRAVPDARPPMPAASRRRLRVLVVDDNADLVDMLALTVEASGHEVRTALDGRTGVLAAISFRPDVVLLDLGLPVMTGLDVARELRRRPELAGIRLVALTGWGQAEDRRRTREAGFDRHLTKPTEPHAVTRLLEEFASEA